MTAELRTIKHLAIIMDGNARWADENKLSKADGHRTGAENIKKILPTVIKKKINYLTLYAFSSENWQREEDEVSYLIDLLSYYLENETNFLTKNRIRLKIIGRINRLSIGLQTKIQNAVDLTQNNNKLILCIAFGYGSRSEIIDACQAIITAGQKFINEANFKNYLYDPEMPDVDLLIRTSGVFRLSNFLLWQAAYAELYFCEKNWPDFSKDDLIKAINDYEKRRRTFGVR